MANALFDKARQRFLEGQFNWNTDTIKAVLVDTGTYTPNLSAHEFLSDIGQEVEVTLVLLEDVGDEFAAVHVLHVVAAAAVEEVGVGLVGDVVADVREVFKGGGMD